MNSHKYKSVYKVVVLQGSFHRKHRAEVKFRSERSAWNFYATKVSDPRTFSAKLFDGRNLIDEYDDRMSYPENLEIPFIEVQA